MFLEGGTQPAVSGQYRFRSVQVYRPAALSTFEKISPQEAVTQLAREYGAIFATVRQGLDRSVCSAKEFRSAGCATHTASAKIFAAADPTTTLVLEPSQPDFSTDANNSALISQQ
jgi:hypothetical protein